MDGALFVFLAVMFVAPILSGALLLRAAVSLYNKFTGGEESPTAVPEPPVGEAIFAMFITAIFNAALGYVFGFAMRGEGVAAGDERMPWFVKAMLLSIAFSVVISAAIISTMLPTTFVRALLVTLLQFLMSLLLGGIISAIVYLVLL